MSIKKRAKVYGLGLLVLLMVTGLACDSGIIESVTELIQISREIGEEYGLENVEIQVSAGDGPESVEIIITGDTSGIPGATPAEKAREVAAYAVQNFEQVASQDEVVISFSTQTGIVSRSESHAFQVDELRSEENSE